ncbi:branched-chain amino acid ABC transporter permease [Parafrankia elaeagni]|uniref:branched-chain amino acid ABC transporter permease n=1 Tax=Parafrankia elaeagni TaxID=222534 RepID=UPI0003824F9E|nr:branched-chain amino acid ABC transporter permease [Parafrankia elaeagni]
MDVVIGGLVSGGLFALVAQSFVLTFLTTRTLNFAVGEFMALAAFIALALAGWGWLPGPLRIAVTVVVLGVLGAVVYRLLVVPFTVGGPHDVRWLLSTVGMSYVLLNLLTNAEGANPQNLGFGRVKAVPTVLGVRLSGQSLLLAGIAIGVTVGLVLLTTRTPLGLYMRAVSADPRTASLMGVSPRAVGMLAYGLATAIAALAGTLWAAEVGVTPGLGSPLLVGALAVGVIGGLTSFWGPLLGGAVYGVTTQFVGYHIDALWGQVAGLLLVVAVLVLRPEGIVGRRVEAKL